MSAAPAAFPLRRLPPILLLRPPNQKLPFSNRCRLHLLIQQSHHRVKQVPIITTTSTIAWCSSASAGSAASPDEESDSFSHQIQDPNNLKKNQLKQGFWMKWKENSAEMSRMLAKLGLAAVLAYGLFDGFTYTTFFVLAFLGFEKSTGKNPAANLKALLGIVILMWTGNNVTRPFRVAGAAALAPFIDKGLRRIQRQFNFPSLVWAFALVAAIVAASCFTVAALLVLSRWGK